MTAGWFSAETWNPANTLGFVTSIVSALLLGVFFWWVGFGDSSTSLTSLSTGQAIGAIVIGGTLSAGMLAIHALSDWRDRWRTSWRLRLLISLPIVVAMSILLSIDTAMISLGVIVMAILFSTGRSYLYFTA